MNSSVAQTRNERIILLIDDTSETLGTLTDVLRKTGCQVVVTQGGDQALAHTRSIRPDLILITMAMPGIDGLETCRRLKDMPEASDVPVIFMMSAQDEHGRTAAFDAGAADCITRPAKAREVLARIAPHLALRTARNAIEADAAQHSTELDDAHARLNHEIGERKQTEKNLRQEEARLRRLFESNIIGILCWGAEGNITEANEKFLQMSGYSQEDLRNGKVQWGTITPPEYKSVDWRAMKQLKRTGAFSPYEKEYIRIDGTRCPIMIGGACIDAAKDSGIAFVLDMSEQKRAEQASRDYERRLRRLFDASIIGIVFDDATGCALDANEAFLKIIGYTREDLKAGLIRWRELTPPEFHAISERSIRESRHAGSVTYEKEYIRKDGSRVPVLVGSTFFGDTDDSQRAAFVLDLSERKEAEHRIRYMADHDALTSLPNRVLFRDRLQQGVVHAHRTHTKVAVLFIDLDYFKNINDSLGHQIGDRLLQMVAMRLRECVREDDTVARLGGDEFVLSLPLSNGSGDAALVAQKVLHALDLPFLCDEHELHLGGSIGISLYPDDGTDVDTLMRTADTAMYHAKEKGRGNYQFFTPALNKAAQRRLALTNSLRRALVRDEFEVHYQPQVDLESGQIISAEALLRWTKAGKHAVGCNEFITIAEETGLILQIGDWVLRQACRQLKQWHTLGHTDMAIAVNLSPRQFYQPNFHGRISDILDEAGLAPSSLDLEITEGVLMQRSDDNVSTLQHLSDMGIKLSVDDFGTGYSSLAYLQRFPVDALKIDRSFVSGIGQDRNDTTLVTAIIAMAHSLRLKVLAEGVETPEQIRFLLAQGCRSAQGYYYSVPVSAEVFTGMLRERARQAWQR
ncbi:EAL domain-containing protein [Noviherbaspirillum cavernae]|nr:EAL domain-containing protein [Noviherbaspirillum cavernae]